MEQFSLPGAIANIKGGGNAPNLFGEVRFYQKQDCVQIVANISGLPQTDSGFFGFHIHEGKSCSGNDFSETANHYNPSSCAHPMHAGDLPPLMRCHGGAYQSVTSDRFRVSDVIGKTVVIHSDPDDFHSQPSGNAGTKIACGVILQT